MNNKLNKHDELSLALHAAVKRELLLDPDRVLTIAKSNLDRWRNNYDDEPHWVIDWTEILQRGVFAVIQVLDSKDEISTLLRSSSPFTGIITQEERIAIINELKKSIS